MRKIINQKNSADAVSPVVGVMLMLVVTIIIAAVVSAFAGGLGSEHKKTPTATMDITIDNMGTQFKSKMVCVVKGVSEPISTKDVKIVTSWTAKDGTKGGATVLPWTSGTTPNVHIHNFAGTKSYTYHAPIGYGARMNWTNGKQTPYTDQYFGNYTLEPTSGFVAPAAEAYGFAYTGGTMVNSGHPFNYDESPAWVSAEDMDSMMAVLGRGWNHLRAGDIVNVRFIYIPTGGMIFEKDVIVEDSGGIENSESSL
jgi:archaeal type IV pilus assembly protein PilA